MNRSKAAIVVSQIIEKIQIIIGGSWAFMMIIGILGTVFGPNADAPTVIVCLALALLGVWMVWCGIRRKKMRLEFRKYIVELSNDPTGTIDNLAAATGKSVDVVKKNLQFMIQKGYFASAYIDERQNKLVLANREQKVAAQSQSQAFNNMNPQPHSVEKIEYVTCTCPNCGGINKIVKGGSTECDFCGSPLTGK